MAVLRLRSSVSSRKRGPPGWGRGRRGGARRGKNFGDHDGELGFWGRKKEAAGEHRSPARSARLHLLLAASKEN